MSDMQILMCPPVYYGIKYEINPWMDLNTEVDHDLSQLQWENLYNTIKKCGVDVKLIPPVIGLPDMVFTANAGLICQNKILLSHFRYKERRGEMLHFKHWFQDSGFEILSDPTINSNLPYFEGAGDALFAGEKLFVGYGFRSDIKFYQKSQHFNQNDLFFCELVNPYFYHLDTCFCPINNHQAIWYPEAFSKTTQLKMKKQIDLIEVSKHEALHFACNAVIIGNNVILPKDCPLTSEKLASLNFNVYACDMSQYIKAGGACKCLTLVLKS